MRFLRRRKKLSAAMLVVLIVVIGAATLAIRFVASFSPVPLVISKETTYITKPLRSDGTPDYVAAMNRRLSAGVTPKNNAAALFWRAAGPRPIPKDCRTKYFRMLGIPQPPDKGDYFVTSETWIERRKPKKDPVMAQPSTDDDDPLSKLLEPMLRPWSKKEFPSSAEWLAANEKPLAIIVEGCNRPRLYDPVVLVKADEETLIQALQPDPQQCRDFARCLVLRAMLYVKEGKTDKAWSDLLACHRLARLAGQGPFVVEALVAITIEAMAMKGDEALLRHAKLTAPQIARMQQDLAGLAPIPRMLDVLDQGERLMALDLALWTSRLATLDRRKAAANVGFPLAPGIDRNIVLRGTNSWYDRLVAAIAEPTCAKRRNTMAEVDRGLSQQVATAKGWTSLASQVIDRRVAVSTRVGLLFARMMVSAVDGASTAEDRATMQFDVTKLAFALAAYHARHSRYPAKLATLVPKYVKEVPKDIFNNDADLHYLREGDGYLLYSVGDNGKDDGGKTRDDAKNGENWDDLVVRMSAAKP